VGGGRGGVGGCRGEEALIRGVEGRDECVGG